MILEDLEYRTWVYELLYDTFETSALIHFNESSNFVQQMKESTDMEQHDGK